MSAHCIDIKINPRAQNSFVVVDKNAETLMGYVGQMQPMEKCKPIITIIDNKFIRFEWWEEDQEPKSFWEQFWFPIKDKK